MSISKFYDSGLGTYLIDDKNYPDSIKEYLNSEMIVLDELSKTKKVIIEVGCMNGRYFEWAMHKGHFYIGIDIIQSYIQKAQKRADDLKIYKGNYKLYCLNADRLDVLVKSIPFARMSKEDILIFFPFNCFGNIEQAEKVISCLAKINVEIFISTYKTDTFSNTIRETYYRNCNYRNINKTHESKGIRFTSNEGLNTIAYYESWMKQCFFSINKKTCAINLGFIGKGYLFNSITGKNDD